MGRDYPRPIVGTPHKELPGRNSHRYVKNTDDVQNADDVCAVNRTASELDLHRIL